MRVTTLKCVQRYAYDIGATRLADARNTSFPRDDNDDQIGKENCRKGM